MDLLRKRYAEAKLADDARNTLIEDLLQKVGDMQKTMERNAFVLVLIDGDCMNFLDDLVRQGIAGGDEAAKLLRRSVFEYLRYDEAFKHDHKIVIRVYANLRGLSKAYASNGILANPTAFSDFVLGFNKAHPLCDFIDAGNHKEAADTKLKEILNLDVYNVHCKQIIFGASADNGYASFLSSFFIDTDVSSRLRLLKGPPFSFEFKQILPKFRWTEFKNVFRSELITNQSHHNHPGHKKHGSESPLVQEMLSGTTIDGSAMPRLRNDSESDAAIRAANSSTMPAPQGTNSPANFGSQTTDYDLIEDTEEILLTGRDKQANSVPRLPSNIPKSFRREAKPEEGAVFAALIRATNERLEESPKALDFGVVKSKAEQTLAVTSDFWGTGERDEWFSKSKNIIKMAVENWIERTDNPPPKNATWMLRYFHPGQSPSAVMKSPSAQHWRTLSP